MCRLGGFEWARWVVVGPMETCSNGSHFLMLDSLKLKLHILLLDLCVCVCVHAYMHACVRVERGEGDGGI